MPASWNRARGHRHMIHRMRPSSSRTAHPSRSHRRRRNRARANSRAHASTCPLLRKHRQRQPQHRNRDYPNSSHSSTSLYRPVTMPTQRRMRLSPHRFQEPPLPVRILSRSSKLSLDSVALRLFFTRHSVRARPVTEPPPRDGLCQTISLANDFAPSYISN